MALLKTTGERTPVETVIVVMIAATLCAIPLMFVVPLAIGLFIPAVDNREIFPIIKQALPYIVGGLLTLLGQWFERMRQAPPKT